MPDVARADADWLALREPADAAARSKDLVETLRPHLPRDGMIIHDLGCGTSSMARWLAPQLPGLQHWVGYERDEELLSRAAVAPPPTSLDGHPVTTERRLRDITHLRADDLDSASLVTASALLDMMTGEEIERMVASIAAAECPALITLSVVGHVELTPAHPLDGRLTEAFNAHQRRATGHGQLLGPDAVGAAASEFQRTDHTVRLASSPWQLDARDTELLTSWIEGWVDAACEQEHSLRAETSEYRTRHIRQIEAGQLTAAVHHRDLLALP
ncbi:class I SAM-dependent methyltransferase [Janibacter cremeus]|uniref:class I SAM-dependent methyltransferase n=1 Tax=Janibacter cremeus TaxID=1285192 RepID=UPI0023F835BE|nr:class I SAM-dependent methyltransferase [Janibacter cremeus]WEV78823.1 class I SAM-dependent methyltransferase [Janibacter cremeus]